jgi:Flp pilus assembly protein TadG
MSRHAVGAQVDQGQATVELVLLLPVIVLALAAIAQVTVLARDRLLVVHAAREAARAAAVDPTPQAASNAARQATGLDPDRLSVTLGSERAPGDRLRVTVIYRAPTSVILIGPLLGDKVLSSDVTVRIE